MIMEISLAQAQRVARSYASTSKLDIQITTVALGHTPDHTILMREVSRHVRNLISGLVTPSPRTTVGEELFNLSMLIMWSEQNASASSAPSSVNKVESPVVKSAPTGKSAKTSRTTKITKVEEKVSA
jgi:hypothetical protein